MPCSGPSSEQCRQEEYNEKLQVMLKYLYDKLNINRATMVPKFIADFLKLSGYDLMNDFPNVHEWMCDQISEFNEIQLDSIVYNAKSKNSRDLANWWEEHSQHDLNNAQTEVNDLNELISDNKDELVELLEKKRLAGIELHKIKSRKV